MVAITTMAHRLRSLLCTSGALLMGATRGTAFSPGVCATTSPPRRTSCSAAAPATAAAAAAPSASHALQRIWDELSAGAQLHEVEGRMLEVETGLFSQAAAWSKTFTPLRTVVAEVADAGVAMSVSVLVLPRGTKLEWQRHDEAQSMSRQLFGSVKVCDLELQGSDNARKLEQQELEATYTDAWAVGGSEESDCVCRGGRCPRMWDCPFWVDRRRAEAKGSSAHVALKVPEDISRPGVWRAGPQTVRRLETLEPSALLEIHVGPRNTRYYQEIESQVEDEDAVELIEVLTPLGVKPGVCRYLGPFVELRE